MLRIVSWFVSTGKVENKSGMADAIPGNTRSLCQPLAGPRITRATGSAGTGVRREQPGAVGCKGARHRQNQEHAEDGKGGEFPFHGDLLRLSGGTSPILRVA